ncbi:MAG TPA: bifunctional 4-hydroxy-2-oxoglutarate aldolase/2-dehydro-3-deoxy-phosphogluconate aldolase [Rhodothermales bacterium]|nr:bifunctional 4-hydroxy-2-oxoglutarate aldolase/2-dehydro-3-deoxy-phosphogluconate aldolase [Rhodothermales bacterium]
MSLSRAEIVQRVIDEGVVAVIRLSDPAKLPAVIEAIADGGVRAIEITLTVPGAIEQIAMADKMFGDSILLGVGSVINRKQAVEAVEAGAKFVVSPIFRPKVVNTAIDMGVPAFPGAFTPTEIMAAVRAGADIVKVFPADVVGMPFFKAVKAPMPDLKLMPTGGVSLTNAGEWLAAGACAVGIGSALLTKKAVSEGDYAQLRENARIVRENIDMYRAGKR